MYSHLLKLNVGISLLLVVKLICIESDLSRQRSIDAKFRHDMEVAMNRLRQHTDNLK